MGISQTSAKIIGTCTISVGTNIPNHNPAISNVNCEALKGRVHLLGYVLASNRGCFRDEHCREHGNLGGAECQGCKNLLSSVSDSQTCIQKRANQHNQMESEG